jgi:hypothetical protein
MCWVARELGHLVMEAGDYRQDVAAVVGLDLGEDLPAASSTSLAITGDPQIGDLVLRGGGARRVSAVREADPGRAGARGTGNSHPAR